VAVDLITWIRQEHDGLAMRLHDWFVVDVPLDRWVERPGGLGASMAWLTLHASVHQDVAVNVAARGETPVAATHWDRLGLDGLATAAGLDEHDLLEFHPHVDVPAIIAYADAVNDATATWLAGVEATALDAVPPASQRLTEAGFTDASVAWVHARWEGKPVSWFVQWEAIGHGLLHHGEMAALRARLGSH
jgi:hypothetical protein